MYFISVLHTQFTIFSHPPKLLNLYYILTFSTFLCPVPSNLVPVHAFFGSFYCKLQCCLINTQAYCEAGIANMGIIFLRISKCWLIPIWTQTSNFLKLYCILLFTLASPCQNFTVYFLLGLLLSPYLVNPLRQLVASQVATFFPFIAIL